VQNRVICASRRVWVHLDCSKAASGDGLLVAGPRPSFPPTLLDCAWTGALSLGRGLCRADSCGPTIEDGRFPVVTLSLQACRNWYWSRKASSATRSGPAERERGW
jgi:hypothetical protein